MLRAVILDFDGTLNTSPQYYTSFDAAAIEVLAELFDCDAAEANRRITEVKRKALSLTKAMLSLGIDADGFYRSVAERMDIERLLAEDHRIEPLISTLKSQNLRVAMLTNSGRFLIEKALAALRCPTDAFDAVVTSSEVEPKPSLQPFRYTADLLRCRSDESLYVGDRVYQELKPAKEVGMKTVLIGHRSRPDDARWIDWHLDSVHHLPELVKSLQ
jgi:HAD superfamily hydrolase (TIGR01549 family)